MTGPGTPPSHLADRVVLVTGAGSGFGRAVARLAAGRGARIVVTDRDAAAAAETAAAVRADGGAAVAVTADVTEKADLDRAVAIGIAEFGGVDVLVNNAGTMPLAFFADHARALDAWHHCIDVNLKGVVNGIAAVLDHMLERGRGHVVNVASVYGNQGTPGSGVYSATKAAVIALSEALRAESLGRIKVTVVRPTGVAGTNLGSTIVDGGAVFGLIGGRTAAFLEHAGQWAAGTLPPEAADPDDVRYWTLDADDLARQIVAVIDLPWGVNVTDVTVRATGEDYVL